MLRRNLSRIIMHIVNFVQQKLERITKKTIKKVGASSIFALGEDGVSTEDSAGVGSMPKVQVSTAWMLQEIDGYAQDQKKMKEVGDKLLQYLRQIRLGLLSGGLTSQSIRRFQEELKNSQLELQFPNLQDVIDDIKLRAEVELAKLEMGQEEQQWQY